MRSTGLSFATIFLITAMPTAALPPSNPSNTTARASEGSQEEVIGTGTDDKVVCRRDKTIGSRINAKRICMTARDWAKKTAEERQYVEQRQQQMQKEGN